MPQTMIHLSVDFDKWKRYCEWAAERGLTRAQLVEAALEWYFIDDSCVKQESETEKK